MIENINFKKPISIYVHFPFCVRKCLYCDFPSYADIDCLARAYVNALLKEIECKSQFLSNTYVYTIYFGGGTPSLLKSKYISAIVEKLNESFDMSNISEFTIEVNPGTVDEKKLKTYKNIGIDRISIGLQSVNEDDLLKAGRVHTFNDFLNVMSYAQNVGFDNINIDLIFGFPWQTFDQWKNTIDTVIKINPSHISCYDLKIEKNTQLFNLVKTGQYKELPDEVNRKMYYYACEQITKCNYNHYEISNFAKPGCESKHNIVYWKTGEYVGFGSGSFSYLNRKRYGNINNVERYISGIENNINVIDEFEVLSLSDEAHEYAMMGFRLLEGIDEIKFKSRFDIDFSLIYEENLKRLYEKGLIEKNINNIRLTKKGLDFANNVFMEFI